MMTRFASVLTRFAAATACLLMVVSLAGCCQKQCSPADCKQCPGGCPEASAQKCPQGCTKPCCKPTTTTSSAVNSTCPFSGKPVNATVTVAYGEKTVAFCCPGCIGRWDGLSDADKSAKLASTK